MIKEKGGKPVSGLLRRKAPLDHAHRHVVTHPPRRGESLRRTGKVFPVCLNAGQTAGCQNRKCMIREKGSKPQPGLLRRKALLGHAHRHAMTHPPDGERARGAPARYSRCALMLARPQDAKTGSV